VSFCQKRADLASTAQQPFITRAEHMTLGK
jgi:hypothetical protein